MSALGSELAMAIMAAACVPSLCLAGSAAPQPDWGTFAVSRTAADKNLVASISKMTWSDACIAWGQAERTAGTSRRTEALFAYLLHEDLLNSKDRGHVHDRTIDIGMTFCGVLAARGRPNAVNQTTTSMGTDAQIVYRDARLYVYTRPSPDSRTGLVTAVQH